MERINSLFTIENVNEDAYKTFMRKATDLFEHCCIKQGENVTYKFLEVEFYFWSETHKDNKSNKPFVYPRNNTKPAQYLIHGSGMDICLKSNHGYGGILIRSLLRIEGDKQSVVTGPWDCCDALINYTGGTDNVFPILTYVEEKDKNVELGTAKRYNAQDATMRDEPYCFYNNKYVKGGQWSSIDSGQELERYNPCTRETVKNAYSPKPWNRENK